ncbi:Serine/threonine-protein kinase PknB [Aquisphaera giovannonii]|uniref:Serine/threonine-protein kinase PknB n=1 Tax=Aquisphaera giovannonii TaxID=406548 RepID=A0A5B9W872_9BACT|nr:serine/threonine-protein kinase [Aquisphaera giovannonii]QEH36434.1 Serine/threonine-protein kinase PknB [Aquisphaera giovannonii]
MLAKLMEMLTPGSAEAGVYRKRVNIQKRFAILADASSQGSMSKVYKAHDHETGKTVCLKVQLRQKNEAAAARASREEARPPEGAIAVAIVHPHVVRTVEYGETTAGEQYLVMEFIEGYSFQYIHESRLGKTAQKVEWVAQAAEGLAAVHAAGFIHHDVNPRNFLLNRDHAVKVIDFGLAVPNTPAFRGPGNRTGTLQYMAPELIRREPIDERIDIFSLGVVAYELLTGRLPYSATGSSTTMLQRLNVDPIDPVKVKPKLSDELCDALRRLTARRREDRWPSLATLASHLRSIPAKRPRPVEQD